MPLRIIIQRLGKIASEWRLASTNRSPDGGHPSICWPLPDPITLTQFVPPVIGLKNPRTEEAQRHDLQTQEHPGVEIFRNPLLAPEIDEIVNARSMTPSECAVPDGKCCAIINKEGKVRYIACRSFIDVIHNVERSMGGRWGIKMLRMLALDRFGYTKEAEALYRELEKCRGQAPAAMGYARILLSHCHPARALEVVENVLRMGFKGAAVSACHARTLFECGQIAAGVSAAAEAVVSLPDPLWMPADDNWTWGLLRGAADASRSDNALREVVLRSIESIRETAPSPAFLLACASLAESAGDIEEVCRCATLATTRADGDAKIIEEAEKFLWRGHSLSALARSLNQPPEPIADIRCIQLNMPGWILNEVDSIARHALWRNEHGDRLSLALAQKKDINETAGDQELRDFCRRLAEENSAGLVEAAWIHGQLGRTVQLIYKHLELTAFTFSGLQIVPLRNASLCWKVVSTEQGVTGQREATITCQLIQQGQMTMEDYRNYWAADPFDSTYSGVDHSTLRYFSDHAFYDSLFPNHPLSKVRKVLQSLCTKPDWDAAIMQAT